MKTLHLNILLAIATLAIVVLAWRFDAVFNFIQKSSELVVAYFGIVLAIYLINDRFEKSKEKKTK